MREAFFFFFLVDAEVFPSGLNQIHHTLDWAPRLDAARQLKDGAVPVAKLSDLNSSFEIVNFKLDCVAASDPLS